MRCMIDIGPGASAADRYGSRRRIDAGVFDWRKIDDQRVVRDSETAGVMSAAANGEQEFVFAGKIHARDDVCHVGAARDRQWFFVDHRVVNLARLGVIGVRGLNDRAAQARLERADSISGKRFTHSDERRRTGYNQPDMKQLQLVALIAAGAALIGCETTNQTGMGNQEQKRLAQIQRQQQESAQYDESEINLWNAQVDVLNRGTNPAIRY